MKTLGDWFVGYHRAHGTYTTGKANERGKVEGKAYTVMEPATAAYWQQHIEGKRSVGIIPLLEDDTVVWGGIDVDVYDGLDINAVAKKVEHLPVVVFRSKSGGAHIILFLRSPVPASKMVNVLDMIAAGLGYGGSEIFPKQTTRAVGGTDVGNWLNMPYFAAKRTTRYASNGDRALSLEEALARIEKKAITPEQLDEINVLPAEVEAEVNPKTAGLFDDGPPCLQHIAKSGGLQPGTRNEGMYNVGVYLRKKYPDDWKNVLPDYAGKMCDPALGMQELNTLSKSLEKKEYRYACTKAPIAPFCNKRACLRRTFGVGETPGYDSAAEIGALTKYEGEPTYWVAEIDGRRIRLTTDELLSQTLFAKRCAEVLTRVPTAMPEPRWRKHLNDKMKVADVVPAPEDEETIPGQFWVLVERFCIQRAQGTTRDAVVNNYPFTEEGRTYFRGDALLQYLKRHNFTFKNNREVWSWLAERGAQRHEWQIRNSKVNVWSLPEFTHDITTKKPVPDMGKVEF